jgi:hypothetical protein
LRRRVTPVVLVLPDGDFLHHGNDLAVRVLVSFGQEIRLHFDNVVLLLEQPLLKILNLYVQVQRRVVVAAVAPASAALKASVVVSMSAASCIVHAASSIAFLYRAIMALEVSV